MPENPARSLTKALSSYEHPQVLDRQPQHLRYTPFPLVPPTVYQDPAFLAESKSLQQTDALHPSLLGTPFQKSAAALSANSCAIGTHRRRKQIRPQQRLSKRLF